MLKIRPEIWRQLLSCLQTQFSNILFSMQLNNFYNTSVFYMMMLWEPYTKQTSQTLKSCNLRTTRYYKQYEFVRFFTKVTIPKLIFNIHYFRYLNAKSKFRIMIHHSPTKQRIRSIPLDSWNSKQTSASAPILK